MILTLNEKMWLRIYRSKGVGPLSFHSLYRKYQNNINGAFNELKLKGINVISEDLIDHELSKTYNYGANIISIFNPNYPKLLSMCLDAPPFLICKGNINLLNNNTIAIVGSRNASLAGMKIANNLASSLHDYTIVSGMARGIDRHAHLGAINRTIAVLGSGIDKIYPLDNKDLYEELCAKGLIVSEYPIGCDPSASFFHARNRIIAGLSKGVIVVEANLHSGSLITSRYGLEYNRDIFAVPGCPLDQRSHGPNSLIQNGAILVQSAEDIYKNISNIAKIKQANEIDNIIEIEATENIEDNPNNNIDDDFPIADQNKILDLLSTIPVSIDQLSYIIGLDIIRTRRTVIILELQGKIKRVLGDKVVRNV